MSQPLGICNSSPLIALEQIGQLELLRRAFDSILVPPAVVAEVAPTVTLPEWIAQRIPQSSPPNFLSQSLGPREVEVICLGLDLPAGLLILDDRRARRVAIDACHLRITGTIGILRAAKRHGWIHALRPLLDALQDHSFFLSDELREQLLQEANE
jgi:predicted nucleic acid-binding protein